MREETKFNIGSAVHELVASIGWKLFMWGTGLAEEEYWDMIYRQEKGRKEADLKHSEE